MAEKLVHYTCEICGEQLTLNEDRLSAKCSFCGTEYYYKQDNNEALILALNRANLDRIRCDFSDAIKGYKVITDEYPDNAEAHWGLVLSLYGIEYVRDSRTQKFIPTCHRVVEESVLNHPNYVAAIKNAAPIQAEIFERNAKVIDKLQRAIKFKMEDEEEFEVFISFKSKDEQGKPTEDSVIGRRIRDELEKRGIKTFFSDVTLEDRMGDEYEPIIYKALNTCKAFILVATSKENVNAVWVKNEWSRFEERIEKEHLTTGTWFAVFDKIKASELPGFLSTQGFDLRNYPFGYEIKIADVIALKLGKTPKEDKSKEFQKKLEEMQEQMNAISSQGSSKVVGLVEPLVKRMKMELEDSNFTSADKIADKVLDYEPKNEEALLGKLLAENKVRKIEDLESCGRIFDRGENYNNVLLYASEQLKEELQKYVKLAKEYVEISRIEKIYNEALLLLKNNTIYELNQAIILFNKVKGYKDADRQVFVCKEKIEEIKKEEIYLKGEENLQEYNSDKRFPYAKKISCLNNAIEEFEKIKEYKDAGKKIEECKKWIKEIEKEEVEREKREQKKKNKKRILITVSVIMAIIVVITSVLLTIANYPTPIANGIKLKKVDGGYQVIEITDKNKTSVVIPEDYWGKKIISIGDNVFDNCTKLTSVTIGEDVVSIGLNAFDDCTGLINIYYKGDINKWVNIDFKNSYSNPLYYKGNFFIDNKLVTEAVIDKTEKIGKHAFVNYTQLTSITLGATIKSIEENAFGGCQNLKTIYNKSSLNIEKHNNSNGAVAYNAEELFNWSDETNNYQENYGNLTISDITLAQNTEHIISPIFSYLENKEDIAYTFNGNNISITNGKIKGLVDNTETIVTAKTNHHSTTFKVVVNSLKYQDNGSNYKVLSANKNSTQIEVPTMYNNKPVIEIRELAFKNCESLQKLTIGENVTKIGEDAFSNCASLSHLEFKGDINKWVKINFANSFANPLYYAKKLYINNSLVTELEINDLPQVGDYIFVNCIDLAVVTIGEEVTTIGASAFSGCNNLKTIYNKSNLKFTKHDVNNGYIAYNATYLYNWSNELNGYQEDFGVLTIQDITLAQNMEEIVSPVFSYEENKEDITYTFSGNNISITNGKIKGLVDNTETIVTAKTAHHSTTFKVVVSSLTYQDNGTTYSVKSANKNSTQIEIPSIYNGKEVTSIENKAFENCTKLNKITIGENITSIGDSAFVDCYALVEIFNKSSIVIQAGENNAENGCLGKYAINVYAPINELKGTFDVIGGELLVYTFNGEGYLINYIGNNSEITIPESIVQIHAYAFYKNNIIKKVVISNSVKNIEDNAFSWCNNLNWIEIGENVINVKENAFSGCNSLETIYNKSSLYIKKHTASYGGVAQNAIHLYNWSNELSCYQEDFGVLTIQDITLAQNMEQIVSPVFSYEENKEGITYTFSGNNISITNGKIKGLVDNTETIVTAKTAHHSTTFKVVVSSLTYQDNGTTYSVKSANKNSTQIEIPSIYNGKEVTSIENKAFENCTKLNKITIGENITSIGDSAFYNCTYITEIIFNAIECSDFIEKNYVFYKVGQDEEGVTVTIGKNVKRLPANLFVPYTGNYTYSPNLFSLIFEEDSVCTTIGENAFEGCYYLSKVYYNNDVNDWVNINFASYDSNPFICEVDFYLNNQLTTEISIDKADKISAYAFIANTTLTKVVIGKNVTYIGERGFGGCRSLGSVYYGGDENDWVKIDFATYDSNPLCYQGKLFINNQAKTEITINNSNIVKKYAFYKFDHLTEVTLGESVTTIEEDAFYYCSNLNKFTMSDNIVSIDRGVFSNCYKLDRVYYDGDINNWAKINFVGYNSNPFEANASSLYLKDSQGNWQLTSGLKLIVPKGLTKLNIYAFTNCVWLTEIIIPDSINYIGSSVFEGCKNLDGVYYDGDINNWAKIKFEYQDSNPFVYADKLYLKNSQGDWELTNNVEVVISQDTLKMEGYTFYNCKWLTKVIMGDNITYVDYTTFTNCTNLTYNEKNGLKYIGSATNPYYYLAGVTSKNITSAEIENNCKIIGNSVFSSCESLSNVVMPDSLISIGNYAFCKCSSLTSIDIPSGITRIGEFAFVFCYNLKSVYYRGDINSWVQIEFENQGAYTDIVTNPLYYADYFYIDDKLVTQITIDKASKINYYAFYGYKGLTDVTIGESVTFIGEGAFNSCVNITTIEFKNANNWVKIDMSTQKETPVSSEEMANNNIVNSFVVSTYTYWERKV